MSRKKKFYIIIELLLLIVGIGLGILDVNEVLLIPGVAYSLLAILGTLVFFEIIFEW